MTASVNPDARTERLPSERDFAFSIPPQSMTTALDAFTAATGIQVIYNSHLTAGRTSPGVHGILGPDDALVALLGDSNLLAARITENVVTLVAKPPAANAPASLAATAPRLQLDPLHVEAPALTFNHYLYGTVVETAIQGALVRANRASPRNYRVDLNVWLSSEGTVQRSEFLASTGDQALDHAISDTLHGVTVQQLPPRDLPQPLHIRLIVSRPS